MSQTSLAALCARLRATKGVLHKTDIALAYRGLGVADTLCRVGDDCAAIPDGDGHLLLAIEGLLDEFVQREPWFAGYCGVMVNISDVAAMGGRPTAVVDALWTASHERGATIFAGMRAAADAYGVPIVGGHTNARSDADRLAVAVLGRARRLLTSFDARPGDVVMAAIDLRGRYFEPYAYWNASTDAPASRLRGDIALLAELAEDKCCSAGKDISMGGILGTLLMLMECSGVGALVDLDRVPKPAATDIERWLMSFPSYGYLLAVPPANVDDVQQRFERRGIACAAVGTCTTGTALDVAHAGGTERFWDLGDRAFTGVPPPAVLGGGRL
jgi:AIR synthase-related protein